MTQDISQVIGLAALPRSGTTLLTSILGVHSRICPIYEPWNATKEKGSIRDHANLQEFIDQAAPKFGSRDVLLVKETTTYPRFIQNLAFLLGSAAESCAVNLIVLIRTPLHVFTSEVQARREWWGEKGIEVNKEEFGLWAEKTIRNLRLLDQVAERFDALLVSYDAIVMRQELIGTLMKELNLALEPQQLEYERHVNKKLVRGDIGLASNPKPITEESISRRREEMAVVRELIEAHPFFPVIQRHADVAAAIESKGIVRRRDFGSMLPSPPLGQPR
jgi:hypothetical protein